MAYIAVTLNHFRPIQAWARSTGAEARLDMATFELELKARNRYYVLKPRFLVKQGEHLSHSSELSANVIGFIGWLPYPALRWELSSDKLRFKALLREAGEPTPESTPFPPAPPFDYVLKRSMGSFGKELSGPFRAGHGEGDGGLRLPPEGNPNAKLYAERFIAGTNVKVWFWGSSPFYAHRDDYPAVTGDGNTALGELVARRLRSVGIGQGAEEPLADLPLGDRTAMESTVAYQGLAWPDVPAVGRSVWLDYRYGRRYEVEASSRESDNALRSFPEAVQRRIAAIGTLLAEALKPRFAVPVLYSVDGVLDAEGRLWWLEMNSNPILPPDGYPLILSSLFGDAGAPVPPAPALAAGGRAITESKAEA